MLLTPESLYKIVFGEYISCIIKYTYDIPTDYKTYYTILVSDNFEYFKERFINLLKIDNIYLCNKMNISESDYRIFVYTHGKNNFILVCCDTNNYKNALKGVLFNEITCIDNCTKDNSWLAYIKDIAPNVEPRIIKIRETLN